MIKILFQLLIAVLAVKACPDRVCRGELGCFTNTGPFASIIRFGVPLPQTRRKVGTKFTLYNRDNPDGTGISTSSLPEINANRQLKFIVHGFTGDGDTDWVQRMVRELLREGDHNVIVVDWKDGASHPYHTAVANTRIVGAEIALLVDKLKDNQGLSLDNVGLNIGFSLGAHVAGYAGRRLKKVARISGLDPAFPKFEGTDIDVRLDRTDAQFVDVLHTDAVGLNLCWGVPGAGARKTLGHLDFYPNGGATQPGCLCLIEGPVCDHRRATYLYTESINSKCQFKAVPCSSYRAYKEGKCECEGPCPVMGYHARPVDGISPGKRLYLRTNGEDPFCKG